MSKGGADFGIVANDRVETPAWYGFDASWYRRRYAKRLMEAGELPDDEALWAHWEQDEGADGTSPNRFFDEKWYLQHYPDVRRGVCEQGIFRSGFQHYVDIGCLSCAGHWLFSAEYYLKHNTDYRLRAIRGAGYLNIYDHYIRVGDRNLRSAHPFFNPELFIKGCLNRDIAFDPAQGAMAQYLSLEHPGMATVRTSWYFDPTWYLSQYPDVSVLMEEGLFTSPLHHYMTCDEPDKYNPNPYFDETYYLNQYPDVNEAVETGVFRNGYAHFIRTGIDERRNPSAQVDMKAFTAELDLPYALDRAHVDNPFLLWVIRQDGGKGLDEPEIPLISANNLTLRKVEASLPSLFRQPLQFDQLQQPSLSVVVFSRGNFLLDIATLISLYEQNLPGMEVIVASQGNTLSRQRLEQAVEGIGYVSGDERLSPGERLQSLLPRLGGKRLLLVESGVQILPMALQIALEAIKDDKTVGCGKMLTTTNRVLEAGSAVWRDGSVTAYGQGEQAWGQAVSFQRIVEAVQGGLLFCQKHALDRALHYLDGRPTEAFFTCLSIALRAVGEKLLYCPAVQAKLPHTTLEAYARVRMQDGALRQIFPGFLPTHPIGKGDARASDSNRLGVMMVFPHLPRLVEGGPTRRIMQQIELFRQRGWRVIVVGKEKGRGNRLGIPHDYPADVECWDGVEDFPSFLQEWQADIKLLWLGGTDMLAQLGPALASGMFTFRDKAIVLDVVSQGSTGLYAMESHLRRLVGTVDEPERLWEEARKELDYAWLCQGIIVGNAAEATLLRQLGYGNLVELPYAVPSSALAVAGDDDFDRREGIVFPLSIYQAGDAGHDGFDWFCLSVMPYLRQHFGEGLPVWIGGYHHPSVDIGFYERLAPLNGFAEVGDPATLLRQCRVLIAPSRVLATQATEILEAAGQGLPAVLSTPQIERLGWQDGVEALDGGFNDPQYFAQQLIRLYEDRSLWTNLSHNAQEAIRKHHNPDVLELAFGTFLDGLFDDGQHEASPPLRRGQRAERHLLAPPPLRILLQEEVPASTVTSDDNENDEEEEDVTPLPTHLGVTLPREDEEWRGDSEHG